MVYLLSISILMTFVFVQSTVPLILSLILITQAVLISLSISVISSTPWFSFILVLIFISGMMVIFIYVSSLTSNFVLSPKLTQILLSFFIFMMSIYFFYNKMSLAPPFIKSSGSNMYMEKSTLSINKIYALYITPMTSLLILYLLLALLVAVKISALNKGPLR